MKKFLKLFPVALAVVALASCSNDDFFGDENVAQREPGKLYVQAEELKDGMSDITRAGFVYGTTASGGSHGQYLVWTENDQVKIYDDNQNWRSQVWKFDAAATAAYKKADGFSVFDKIQSVAGEATTTAPTQYTNAYGVYPANLGVFVNENRTAFQFNLSSLANYPLGRIAVTDTYADGYLAKAPIPMWGVATSADGSSEMKVKYLTGILKVDIAQLPKTTGTNHNWLAVQSKVAGKKANLHPAVVVADFDPETVEAAPALKVEVAAAAATDLTADYTIADAASDVILIDLGTNKDDAEPLLVDKRCCIAVPIVVATDADVPVEQELSAYLYSEIAADAAALAVANQEKIGSSITKTVAAGTMYLIQDEVNKAIDANTPYNLAQQIKTIDEASDRTVNIEVQSNITVDDTNIDDHAFVIDLSEYALKNNVNVTFKAGSAFMGKTNGDNTLIIRTKAGGKGLLTINVAEGANKLKSIKVDDGLAGKLKLTGTITKIEAGNANLTIAADVTTVDATAETNIDAKGKTVATLNILKGCEKVNAKNGTITTVAFGAGAAAIDADVEIATTGNAHIGTVAYANVPNNGAAVASLEFTKKVKFTSVWSGVVGDADAALTAITGTSADANVLISAAQLAGYDFTTAADVRILAENININAANWTPIAALSGGAIDGDINVKPATSTKALTPVNAVIEGMKFAVAAEDNYGLFEDIQKNVSNLTIKDVTVTGAHTGDVNIGALAGITSTAAVTLTNVAVENINITQTGKYADGKLQSIGGIIGQATIGTTLLSASYKDITLQGAACLGGFIGNVASTGSATFGGAAAALPAAPANLCSFTGNNTFNSTTSNYEFDPVYAAFGTYVGSALPNNAANQANVTLYLAAAPSTTIAASAKAPYDKWTTVNKGAIKRWNINRGLNEVGVSGLTGDNIPGVAHADWVVTVYIPETAGANKGKYVEANKRQYKVDAALYDADAKPADYNTAGVYYLNYFNQYLQ